MAPARPASPGVAPSALDGGSLCPCCCRKGGGVPQSAEQLCVTVIWTPITFEGFSPGTVYWPGPLPLRWPLP